MVLAGGTAGTQLFLVAASPLLTRLFSPEEFGGLAVYSSVLTVSLIVASLRYELAIPLPDQKSDAFAVLTLSLLCSAAIASLVAIALWMWGDVFASAFDISAIKSYLWVLPFGIFIGGSYRSFHYYAVRCHAFPTVSKTRMYQVFTQLVVQIAGSPFGMGALIFGHLCGQGVGAPTLARLAVRDGFLRTIHWGRILHVARTYRRFPIYDTWSGLFNSLSHQLPPLFIAATFGAVEAGLYLLAMRVLLMPFDMVGSAIGTSLHASGREHVAAGTLSDAVFQILHLTLRLSLPGLLVFYVVSPALFAWIFGPEWVGSAVIMQALIPLVVARFCASPISVIAFIQQRQKLMLFWQSSYCLAVFSAFYLTRSWEFADTISLYALAGLAWYLMLAFGILASVGYSLGAASVSLSRSVAWSALICLPLLLADGLSAPTWGIMVCGTATAIGLATHYARVLRDLWALNLEAGYRVSKR